MTKPDPETQNLFGESGSGTAMLVAEDIAAMAQAGRLISREFDDKSLQATSYDLRIGERAIVGGDSNETDLRKQRLVIEPGSYAGVISLEKVKLPNNVFAQIGSKRKFSYDGLILLSGSVIDPGYEGYLLFGLYNASTKKVVLPMRTKICNVVFHRLAKEAKPVNPDPYLLNGEFPPEFLKQMANAEVLPWARINEEVRRIQELAKDVLDLKAQYNDVLRPIKDLTDNIGRVNNEVLVLTKQVEAVSGQVGKLEQFGQTNAQIVNEIAVSVKALTTTVTDHARELRDVGAKVGKYGVLWTIFWALVLIGVSVGLTLLVRRAFPDGPQPKVPPPVTAPQQKQP